jgi:hypothetical protein
VSSVRLRAIVVSATPTSRDQSTGTYDPHDYEERKLAQGADATTGETTQGLDQLQDLQGIMGVFAVFGKLSVRVPGVFRLRFELYETIRLAVDPLDFLRGSTSLSPATHSTVKSLHPSAAERRDSLPVCLSPLKCTRRSSSRE